MLRDYCGRMLDARPLPRWSRKRKIKDENGKETEIEIETPGLDPKWSGQGRPGDDFIAVFRLSGSLEPDLKDWDFPPDRSQTSTAPPAHPPGAGSANERS